MKRGFYWDKPSGGLFLVSRHVPEGVGDCEVAEPGPLDQSIIGEELVVVEGPLGRDLVQRAEHFPHVLDHSIRFAKVLAPAVFATDRR